MSPRRKAPRKSMAEKRMLVAQGTHVWCKGRGGCRGKGTLPGGNLPHARCKGDGLIKLRKPRGRGRPGGGRRAAGGAVGAGALWFGLGQWLGTIGYVLAAVILAVVAVLWVLGGIAQATGLVTK